MIHNIATGILVFVTIFTTLYLVGALTTLVILLIDWGQNGDFDLTELIEGLSEVTQTMFIGAVVLSVIVCVLVVLYGVGWFFNGLLGGLG